MAKTPSPPTPQYLRIRGWSKFQHYRQDRPPWLKLYGSRLNEGWYCRLTPAQRGLWVDLLTATAASNQWLPYDVPTLRVQLGHAGSRWFVRDLKLFVSMGIVTLEPRPSTGFGFAKESRVEVVEEKHKKRARESPPPSQKPPLPSPPTVPRGTEPRTGTPPNAIDPALPPNPQVGRHQFDPELIERDRLRSVESKQAKKRQYLEDVGNAIAARQKREADRKGLKAVES